MCVDYTCFIQVRMYVYVRTNVCMHICMCVDYTCICVCRLHIFGETPSAEGSGASMLSMGWLRLVGSLKLQVSFAKESYERDYILQKRPIMLRSLLIVTTP